MRPGEKLAPPRNQRRALGLGAPMAAKELDAWACDTVDLFLRGCQAQARGRP